MNRVESQTNWHLALAVSRVGSAKQERMASREDEVRAPLHRLNDVRQFEQIRAQAFDIHGKKVQGSRYEDKVRTSYSNASCQRPLRRFYRLFFVRFD
jgi:hypothetical protein